MVFETGFQDWETPASPSLSNSEQAQPVTGQWTSESQGMACRHFRWIKGTFTSNISHCKASRWECLSHKRAGKYLVSMNTTNWFDTNTHLEWLRNDLSVLIIIWELTTRGCLNSLAFCYSQLVCISRVVLCIINVHLPMHNMPMEVHIVWSILLII